MSKDYYEVLGVDHSADDQDLEEQLRDCDCSNFKTVKYYETRANVGGRTYGLFYNCEINHDLEDPSGNVATAKLQTGNRAACCSDPGKFLGGKMTMWTGIAAAPFMAVGGAITSIGASMCDGAFDWTWCKILKRGYV